MKTERLKELVSDLEELGLVLEACIKGGDYSGSLVIFRKIESIMNDIGPAIIEREEASRVKAIQKGIKEAQSRMGLNQPLSKGQIESLKAQHEDEQDENLRK